jgi:DNA mismatch repair protein MutS2
LLDVRDTLIAGYGLHRVLSRLGDQFPGLADCASRIPRCPNIVDEINRCLDERGNVRDGASRELARIRREERVAGDQIQNKLQHIIRSPQTAPFLQEALITQREGRYVIPLKADFRGRIRGITHDISASGATLFIEPLSVVELNNTWRQLQLAEQQEVDRILASLSALIADQRQEVEQTVETLAELDLAFAKARYAEALDATEPELIPFRPVAPSSNDPTSQPGATIRLLGARHPLLEPEAVVPIDVALGDGTHVLVITGPNTGGKTVGLKTVGLLTLMAQAGMHIPAARGSTISPFEAVYADIGDEQSIEQNLSTFSSHLTNILSFLDRADGHSLVLLDELGAGTDPAEGAALARALLDYFRARGATALVATHYPELKTYAQLTSGVRNACVEFDPETLSPTFTLTIGLPGRSNALAIAQRLGLPKDIVEAARQMVSPEDLRTEDMLADIHRLRVQTAKARDSASAALTEAESLKLDLYERLARIEEERQEVLAQAQEEASDRIEGLDAEVRALRQRLQAAAAPLEDVAVVESAVQELAAGIRGPEPRAAASVPGPGKPAIRPGDTVWVRPLNAPGQVLTVNGAEAEVQTALARTRVGLASLELRPSVAAPPTEREPGAGIVRVSDAASPGVRIDLRGCVVEEALQQLDRHLDLASRAGLPWVRIIHGKGTGALRRAVRQFLSDYPLVSSYKAGGAQQGGEGITVAILVQA